MKWLAVGPVPSFPIPRGDQLTTITCTGDGSNGTTLCHDRDVDIAQLAQQADIICCFSAGGGSVRRAALLPPALAKGKFYYFADAVFSSAKNGKPVVDTKAQAWLATTPAWVVITGSDSADSGSGLTGWQCAFALAGQIKRPNVRVEHSSLKHAEHWTKGFLIRKDAIRSMVPTA